MNNLQASMRDRAARNWTSSKVMFKVGGPMKGCLACGEICEHVILKGKRAGEIIERYSGGFAVYRSYYPQHTGWTWKCMECGRTDLACWEPDQAGKVLAELGKEPIVGCRTDVGRASGGGIDSSKKARLADYLRQHPDLAAEMDARKKAYSSARAFDKKVRSLTTAPSKIVQQATDTRISQVERLQRLEQQLEAMTKLLEQLDK